MWPCSKDAPESRPLTQDKVCIGTGSNMVTLQAVVDGAAVLHWNSAYKPWLCAGPFQGATRFHVDGC